jgi:hypothetical protein
MLTRDTMVSPVVFKSYNLSYFQCNDCVHYEKLVLDKTQIRY